MKIRLKIATQANAQYLNCNLNHVIEIDFEDYIARVVASEIGNASLEACKAQAIAARTFAVGRGVLNGKEISDSSASAQACRLNRTEYENANKAAKETAGQVLTYDGKIISAVYSDANGGRTYSSKEVWGSDRPYLIARTDPWDAATGKKKNGHGIGLSQAGAAYAAKIGNDYKGILKFYYPGTKIVSNYNQKQLTVDGDDYERKVMEEIKIRVQLALQTLKEGLE